LLNAGYLGVQRFHGSRLVAVDELPGVGAKRRRHCFEGGANMTLKLSRGQNTP
jgi:hypothetical protein